MSNRRMCDVLLFRSKPIHFSPSIELLLLIRINLMIYRQIKVSGGFRNGRPRATMIRDTEMVKQWRLAVSKMILKGSSFSSLPIIITI